jgi:hypothetical protein
MHSKEYQEAKKTDQEGLGKANKELQHWTGSAVFMITISTLQTTSLRSMAFPMH